MASNNAEGVQASAIPKAIAESVLMHGLTYLGFGRISVPWRPILGGFHEVCRRYRHHPPRRSRRHSCWPSRATATLGLAIGVVLETTPDPIFAAIDAHREAGAKFHSENAKLGATDIDDRPAQAALVAWAATAEALIGTPPTTRAGVRALDRHLREGDGRFAVNWIERPMTLASGRTCMMIGGGPEGIDYLIGKRAAALAA
jgi:hypothetical protein